MGAAMTCEMCAKRGQTWSGSAPVCSFPDGGEFTSKGWNCATANAIRDITGQHAQHPAADCRYCDDQYYSTIKIDGIKLPGDQHALALWVTWYKRRGRTDGMWLLSEGAPRKPTEADARAIIAALAL